MGPIVKIKKWRAKKAREAMIARLRLEVVEIRNYRRDYQSFAGKCPKCDSLCACRDAVKHLGLALAQAEKDALERLAAVS